MSKFKIEFEIEEELLERIQIIQNYENFKNLIRNKERNAGEINDFIVGATIKQINIIENYEKISSNTQRLGRPYQLKNQFKEHLKRMDMKQIELSEITGIDKGNLSLILNNKTQPSLDYFMRIWVALRCPPIEEVLYRD